MTNTLGDFACQLEVVKTTSSKPKKILQATVTISLRSRIKFSQSNHRRGDCILRHSRLDDPNLLNETKNVGNVLGE